jgi:ligand-binding sensor domain-containing protein
MRFYLSAVLFCFLCPLIASAQEFGYTHYNSKDGLAGSTVYCMTQDKDGFMWFGTETGLSRFDGTHFKKFTQDDGLPDNEIIQVFADSKGRVWISPFKKTVCYYYKGKIHNSHNDPLLKRISISDNVLRFAEDTQGDILMQETSCLHLIKANGEISSVYKIGNDSLASVSIAAARADGGFWVVEKNNLFEFNNNHFSLRKKIPFLRPHYSHVAIADETMIYVNSLTTVSTLSLRSGKTVEFPNKSFVKHIAVVCLDRYTVASLSRRGAIVYNINRPDSLQFFLPGIPVSGIFKDTEGSLWFSTLGKGTYRLNSASVMNLKIREDKNEEYEVSCFARIKESVLAGTNLLSTQRLSVNTGKPIGDFKLPLKKPNVVFAMCTLEKNRLVIAGAPFIWQLTSEFKLQKYIEDILVKAVCVNNKKLLVATNKNVIELDPDIRDTNPTHLFVIDTIWHGRATAMYANNDTIYIGALNGLYRLLPDKTMQFPGEKIPFLQTRIAAITQDQNYVVWVATYGNGIVGWKNGRVIKHISEKEGLTSNICRTLFLDSNSLWVGTDRGLNKINLAKPDYPIKKYTTGDGLATDIINALYVSGSKVFVGTPEGVTFFDEQKMNSLSRCDLTFTDVAVGGQTLYPTDMPSLIPHVKNDLQFNYVGISYKSGGDVRYRYRLLGLDSNWRETRETFLSYPTLPSGHYQLQVQAINKFDVVSKMITAGFTIEKLMWETTWFRLSVGLVFLAITGSLAGLIIFRIRRREQEKTAINKKIGDLEQLARKAQMNPHFIFNSLNSIQQYVMDADITGANKFISGFSRLMRQTLDFSSKQEISLEQELGYLSNYLELERTRLENAFGWSVTIASDVNTAEYHIPPMILQPFVENSVRHGLRFRRDRDGVVSIHIKKENNYLVCVLEDNGIGRKAALKFKSVNAIEYQSKGMSLTAERIAMLNKDNDHKITMHIEDLEDDQHKALGTRVTISFPIFDIT